MIKIIAMLSLCAVMSFTMLVGCADDEYKPRYIETGTKVIFELPGGEVISGVPEQKRYNRESGYYTILLKGVTYVIYKDNVAFVGVGE